MKRFGIVIGLAIVLAIGLLVWLQIRDVGEREAANQTVPSGQQRLLASQRPEPTKQSVDGRSAAGAHPGLQFEDQRRLPADFTTNAHSGIQPQPTPQTEAPSPNTDQAQGVDYSVVGHPFPVSESILAACRRANPQRSCAPNKKLLNEMVEEPREEPWATSAEQAIRALVELEPGTQRTREVSYAIRALECRTSICFVETASIMGGFATQLYYFEKDTGLTAQYAIDSAETDASGNKVHVTLWPFVRN